MKNIFNKKIKKYFIYLIVILSIFVFDKTLVNALETQEINLCTDEGYAFLLQYEGEDKKGFYDEYGNDTALTKKLHGKAGQSGSFVYNGITYNYSSIGVYKKFGNSKNTSRCFKIVNGEKTVTDFEDGSGTMEAKYFTSGDWCGEQRIAGSEPFVVVTNDNKEIPYNENTGMHEVIFELSNNDPNSNMLNDFWDDVVVTSLIDKGIAISSVNGSFPNVTKRILNGKKQIVVSNVKPAMHEQEPTLVIAVTVKVDNENKIFTNNIKLKKGNYTFGTEAYALDDGEITLSQLKKYCGDTLYVASDVAQLLYDTEVDVINPYLDNQYCVQIREFSKAGKELKKSIAPECFNEKIDLGTINSRLINNETIKEKYESLVHLYENSDTQLTQLVDVDDLDCTSGFLGIPSSNDNLKIPYETKVTYEETGKYWAMVCKEEYYIESDVPQLVEAGMGVHYNNKAEVIKSCTIINTNQVKMKPKCTANVSDLDCHYDICTYCDSSMRNEGWDNPETAGPNGDFDQCVLECDGGLYSQSCINKCYNQVYGSDRKLSIIDNVGSKTNKVERFGYKSNSASGRCSALVTGLNDTSCNTGNSGIDIKVDCVANQPCIGKPNCCYIMVNGEKHKEIGVSNYCAGTESSSSGNLITVNHGAGTVCDFSYSVGPSGCSWDPAGDYARDIQSSKDEYNYFYDLASKKAEIANYTIEIQDSKSNNIYSISGSTTKKIEDNPNLEITYLDELSEESTKKKDNKKVSVQIGSQGDTIDVYKDYTNVSIYSISLPVQHVNKGDYNDIVVKNYETNKYYTFNDKDTKVVNNSKHYKFKEFNQFKAGIYTAGQNVYYTNFASPEINVSTITDETRINEIINSDYGKAYIIYNVNGRKYLKELTFNFDNIKVYFTIDTVGSENKNKSGVVIRKFTEDTGYVCYYGIPTIGPGPTPPPTGTPTPPPTTNPPTTPPPSGDPIVPKGLKYYYREIYLEPDNNSYGGVFPNGRNPRWNWTGTIVNGQATGAASNSDPSYIVDPEKLIQDIEKKGDSIYINESEYDYVFTLTTDIINDIRKYNDTKVNGKKVTYVDFSLVAGSTAKKNYSEKIKDWFSQQTLYSQAYSITECNNAISGKCDN